MSSGFHFILLFNKLFMKPSRVAILGADWPVYELYCPNFTGMQEGLKTLGIEHKLFGCRPALDVQAVIDYEPDLVIYGLLDMVKAFHTRMRIRRELPNAKIVMWYGDLRNRQTSQVVTNMSEIDMMFVSNDAQSEYYERIWRVPKCHFLPLGSPVYNEVYNQKHDFNFVFIGGVITGAAFLERAQVMFQFRERGLRIINADAQSKPALRAKILKSMPSIYRSSKISLDYSHFTNIQGYTSNRFWIIPASGGFALTKRWPGCEDFYPEGTRVYFDDFDQALELRDYYLTHDDEREQIRAAGYAHARNHTYDKRFLIMFEKLYGAQTKINHARRGDLDASVSPRTPQQEKSKTEL